MKIHLLVLIVLINLSLFAQSGTLTFTGTNQTNIGQILHDGTNSNDISGIQFNIFGALSQTDAASRTNTGSFTFWTSDGLSMSTDQVIPIDVTTGASTEDENNLPQFIVIMSDDGSEFSFESIYMSDFIESQNSTRFQGYRDGTLIGEVVLSISSGYEETFSGTDFPSATFGNVDEVRMSNADGVTTSFIAGFNNITVSGALPVELASFTAANIDGGVKLNWQTASEVNNYGFYIERKYITSNNTGSWTELDFVPGNGTSNSVHNYSYTDANIPASAVEVSYRLKQADIGGSSEYSKTVTVELPVTTDVKDEDILTEFGLAQNYPNPFNPSTVIKYQLAAPGYVSIKVYNLLGKEVKTLVSRTLAAGKYEVEFDGSSLASGIYFYKMQSGSFVSVKKLMLMK